MFRAAAALDRPARRFSARDQASRGRPSDPVRIGITTATSAWLFRNSHTQAGEVPRDLCARLVELVCPAAPPGPALAGMTDRPPL